MCTIRLQTYIMNANGVNASFTPSSTHKASLSQLLWQRKVWVWLIWPFLWRCFSLLSLFLSICPRFENLQEWELISALWTDNVNYECSVMTGVQRAIRNQCVVEQSSPSCSSKERVLLYLPLHAAKFYLLWIWTKTKIEMQHKM